MKRFTKSFVIFLLAAFLGGMVLSSCRVLRGDPRKNCNHPKHGEYMREKRMKKHGF